MKIGFCGTMSVGKTTLVNTLKNIPEFKDYHFATERSKYLNSLGIPLNNDSTLKGQNIFLAERCAELMNEDLITDRTVVDVMAFTKLAKSISYIDGDAFEEYAKRFIREYNYIFYISPEGIAIEDNGVRETDELYRNEIDLNIRQLLAKYQPWHHVLTGSTEERVKQVLKVCFDIY